MSTKITLEYFGMPGVGATMKQARADAGRRIEQALQGDYAPVLVRWRGLTSVMSRHPIHGWGYRFVHSDNPVVDVSICNSGFVDREDCLWQMLKHVADVQTPLEDMLAGVGFPEELLLYIPANRRGPVLSEWATKIKFQQQYAARLKEALADGMPEDEARNYAHHQIHTLESWKKAYPKGGANA